VQAIRDRRRTFFEEHDWRTIPWSLDPKAKSYLDRIVDVLCCIPGIFEDKDWLSNLYYASSKSEVAVSTLGDLKDRVGSLLDQLYRFRWAWEASYPSVCYEVPEPRESPFSPSVLHFASLTRANEVTLYNATLMILLHLADELAVPLPDAATLMVADGPLPPSTNPLRLPGTGDSPRAAASEICRSASFHLADPTNMAGPYFLLFPLALARLEFATTEPERLWIDQFLTEITVKGVFKAETVVGEVNSQTPDWPAPREEKGGISVGASEAREPTSIAST
jgi:hypothetical protein